MRLPTLVSPLVLVSLLCAPAVAQDPSTFVGHWEGEIETIALAIDVDIAYEGGEWSGDVTIAAQSVRDRALVGFRLADGALTFQIDGIPGDPTFVARPSEDGATLAGPFTQGGAELTFSLSRAQDAAAVTAEAIADLEEFLVEVMADWEVPGLGLAVVRNGEVVLARGYGKRDIAADLPVTAQTLFAIGSSSKAFTTFAMGQLVDEGVLDWDTPLIRYLPGFQLEDEYAAAHLTPRDMVCHRSGLPRHDLAWYNRADLGPAELFERLVAFSPNRELRQQFQYNNMMFVTAGHLVATLRGVSWEDTVREQILDPLGMRRSNFTVVDSQADPDHALPYAEREDALERIPFRDISNVGPAGSINSCPEEMARWLLAHLGGGEVDGKRLIEASTVREMHTPQMVLGSLPTEPELAPACYGLGWFIDGYRGHLRIQHGGGIDGFTALVTLFPNDDLGICALTNKNGNPLPEFVVRAIADRVFGLEHRDWSGEALKRRELQKQAAEEGEEHDEAERIQGTSPHHALADYAGEYLHPGYGSLDVTLVEEALWLTYNGISAPLEHWHFETFRAGKNPDDPAFEGIKFQFETDVDGRVVALTVPFEASVDRIRFDRAPDTALSDPAYLARFVGEYELAGQRAKVSLSGKALTISLAGQPTITLDPERDDTFSLKGLSGFRVAFTSESGKVTEAVFKQPNGTFVAKRVVEDSDSSD